MPTLACLDGQILPADQAKVSIWDRGFLFGDAVYEVFRLYRGRLWLEAAHWSRLRRSVQAIAIEGVEFPRLIERTSRTIAASEIAEGTVYVHISRGVAPRLHAFPDPPVPPTELIVVRPYDDSANAQKRREGARLITAPDIRWGRCDIKSTNLLANVLANQAAHAAGAFEALLVDEQGWVTEATHSSLLWVRKGMLEGTPEGPEILPGTTRQLVLRLAEDEAIPFREASISLSELPSADEVILMGTSIEVVPIVKVDNDWIGNGAPGPIACRLQAAYARALAAWLDGGPDPSLGTR